VEQKGKNTKGCLRKEESRGIFRGVSVQVVEMLPNKTANAGVLGDGFI
jgi:hypothetical protein